MFKIVAASLAYLSTGQRLIAKHCVNSIDLDAFNYVTLGSRYDVKRILVLVVGLAVDVFLLMFLLGCPVGG